MQSLEWGHLESLLLRTQFDHEPHAGDHPTGREGCVRRLGGRRAADEDRRRQVRRPRRGVGRGSQRQEMAHLVEEIGANLASLWSPDPGRGGGARQEMAHLAEADNTYLAGLW